MVEEVAEVADAGVVNDADLSDRIETLERQFRVFHAIFDNFFSDYRIYTLRQFICQTDDLFCNAQDRTDDNNSMAPLVASLLMSLILLVL